MIVINNAALATVAFAKRLTAEQESQLAGDIENWLMREKSIVCEIKVGERKW